MWATHGPFICLNTLAFLQSVLYHAGHPKERKARMQDMDMNTNADAQEAAAALVAEFGAPMSRDTLEAMLALAWGRGVVAGLAEGKVIADQILADHRRA